MDITPEKLKEILLKLELVSDSEFDTALKDAQKEQVPLVEYLVRQGVVEDKRLGRAIADYLDYPLADFDQGDVGAEEKKLIPEVAARNEQAVIFRVEEEKVFLATFNPEDFEFINNLERKIGRDVKVFFATPIAIKEALRAYQGSLREEISDLLEEVISQPDDEKGVVDLLNGLLKYAYINRASDIHLEPLEEKVMIRFRIDGILHQVIEYPKKLHSKIVFRVKILSQLATDEHHTAQDGSFKQEVEGDKFDVRVSIMPVTGGENVVMRLLSERTKRFVLDNLGFADRHLEKIKQEMKQPDGMILAVGPTGSGKTTALYAILRVLNEPGVNITTIEDPVEFDIAGVQQVQVDEARDLTFAKGLRSIVRQDPDIIMVGEIRDAETADIAVNAAMTGHLVLSTMHANDAATTFPRFSELGVEAFLVASSVELVIARRLVRTICSSCRESHRFNEQEINLIKRSPEMERAIKGYKDVEDLSKVRTFKGEGCKKCNGTGFQGRTGISEIIDVDENIRPLISAKASASKIEKEARKQGMQIMIEDGAKKLFQGKTTIGELARVIES